MKNLRYWHEKETTLFVISPTGEEFSIEGRVEYTKDPYHGDKYNFVPRSRGRIFARIEIFPNAKPENRVVCLREMEHALQIKVTEKEFLGLANILSDDYANHEARESLRQEGSN